MDCDAFREHEIDALYEELDPKTSAAMEAHAASCAACSARMAKLRATRRLLSSMLEPAPAGLEARVLATADRTTARSGARIFRLFARPELAVAASVVLVAGAAVIYAQSAKTMSMAPSADQASAQAGAKAAEPASTAMPAPMAAAESAPMASGATATASAVANGPALALAKTLYESGRYTEACSRFEALAANDPEADLFATRCVARTKGCASAAPRFDSNAARNVGTEIGSRAALEAARCYRAMGDARAGARYAALKNDAYVADEAESDTTPAAVAARKAVVASPPAAAAPAATAAAKAGGGAGRAPAAKPSPAKPAARPDPADLQ